MFYNSPRQKKKKKSFGKIVSSRVYNTNRIKMPSSFPSSSPYISGVLLSSQTQKQGERETERERGIGKKCLVSNSFVTKSPNSKNETINPLLSLVVKRVCSSAKRTERQREREKETKLLKLKAALLYSSFPRCSKPKAKLGSHKCISLCLFVWGVGVHIKDKKNTEEEKKGRVF